MQYHSLYSCHADSAAYPHNSRVDKGHYRHDRHAVKRRYRHDRRAIASVFVNHVVNYFFCALLLLSVGFKAPGL